MSTILRTLPLTPMWPFRSVRFYLITTALALLAVACGNSTPAERSFQDDLEIRLGRKLSPAEVVEYKDAAELLCSVDEGILTEVWDELDEDQFDFQTFVFTVECPEREAIYRQARLEQRTNTQTTSPTSTSTSQATGSTSSTPTPTASTATTR